MLEKGGIWDRWNRWTQKWEKRVIAGGAAVWIVTGAPLAAWVTIEATKWFVVDWGSEKLINKGAEKIGLKKKSGGSAYSMQLNHGLEYNNMSSFEVKAHQVEAVPSQGSVRPDDIEFKLLPFSPRRQEVQLKGLAA